LEQDGMMQLGKLGAIITQQSGRHLVTQVELQGCWAPTKDKVKATKKSKSKIY